MSKTIFDTPRRKPRILVTHDSILKDLSGGFPPISGLPEGKIRVRLRADEIAPIVHVRTAEGIRAFMINVDDDGKFSRGPEMAASYRLAAEPPAPDPIQGLDREQVIAAAQAQATHTGKKWVWYVVDDIHYHAKPAEVLHLVQLNDTVLAGDIVVLEKRGRKEVYNLLWPELSDVPAADTVAS